MIQILNSSSLRIPESVLYDKNLSESEVITYLKILSVMPDSVPSWRPFDILVMDTGIPSGKLRADVEKLCRLGYVSVANDGVLPARYKSLFRNDSGKGFIYFASGKKLCGNCTYKVGFTSDPHKRIKTLQKNVHGVSELKFIKIYKVKGRAYALYLESCLKRVISESSLKEDFGTEYFSPTLIALLHQELDTITSQYGECEEVTNDYQSLGSLL